MRRCDVQALQDREAQWHLAQQHATHQAQHQHQQHAQAQAQGAQWQAAWQPQPTMPPHPSSLHLQAGGQPGMLQAGAQPGMLQTPLPADGAQPVGLSPAQVPQHYVPFVPSQLHPPAPPMVQAGLAPPELVQAPAVVQAQHFAHFPPPAVALYAHAPPVASATHVAQVQLSSSAALNAAHGQAAALPIRILSAPTVAPNPPTAGYTQLVPPQYPPAVLPNGNHAQAPFGSGQLSGT